MSERFTMTVVIRDEKANSIALAVRTPIRAEETPITRETTTKMGHGKVMIVIRETYEGEDSIRKGGSLEKRENS